MVNRSREASMPQTAVPAIITMVVTIVDVEVTMEEVIEEEAEEDVAEDGGVEVDAIGADQRMITKKDQRAIMNMMMNTENLLRMTAENIDTGTDVAHNSEVMTPLVKR